MSKKLYFIRYWRDFANTFNLAWADNDDDREWLASNGFEQCTRKYAETKARNERYARKFDQAFSGYGDDAVFPTKYWRLIEDEKDAQTWLYDRCELEGLIWE